MPKNASCTDRKRILIKKKKNKAHRKKLWRAKIKDNAKKYEPRGVENSNLIRQKPSKTRNNIEMTITSEIKVVEDGPSCSSSTQSSSSPCGSFSTSNHSTAGYPVPIPIYPKALMKRQKLSKNWLKSISLSSNLRKVPVVDLVRI